MIKKEPATLHPRFDRKHYGEIIEYYTLKLELDKTNYFYWGARGAAYLQLFNIEEATLDLTQAIELKPDYAMGLYNRGRCYFELEEFEMAIIEFEKSKSIDKSLVVNDYFLGFCYGHFGDYYKAIECFTSFEIGDAENKYRHNNILSLRADLYYLTNQNEKASRDITELFLEDIENLADLEKLNEAKKSDNKPREQSEDNFLNIFDETCQQRWINDLGYNEVKGVKFDNESLRRYFKDRFLLLKEKTYFEELIRLLAIYFETTIPNYLASENKYWVIICLATGSDADSRVVEIYQNDKVVLTVYEEKDGSFYFRILGSKIPYLKYLKQNDVDSFVNQISPFKLEVRKRGHEEDSKDEVLHFLQQENFEDALNNPLLLSSMRLSNLRIMNNVDEKNDNFWRGHHCLDLADAIINLLDS